MPLDVISEATPDSPSLTTENALALQQPLLGAHDLGEAAERQKRNYDKRASSKSF